MRKLILNLFFFLIIFLNCSQNTLEVKSLEDVPDAVVRIEVTSTQAELDNNLNIEVFEYSGSGSGFFINPNGFIITNNHVISGAVTIDVYTSDSETPYNATIVGQSECDDIAILKINKNDTKYLLFSEDEPVLGEEILAVGFPRGDEEVTFLDGIVSKRETNGSTTWASFRKAFEHTAEILPGSSGGPILNDRDEIIGIAYAGNEDRQEFGIPIVEVEEIINLILSGEFVYTLNAHIEQIPEVGIYVYSTEFNSPLRDAGLKGGEVITKIGGKSIEDELTLESYCSYIKSRSPESGLKFSGVSLKTLKEFDIETSLEGVLTNDESKEETPPTTLTEGVDDSSNDISNTTTTLPEESICLLADEGDYLYAVPFSSPVIQKAVSDFPISFKMYSYIYSNSNTRENLVQKCIDEGHDLIIASGFLFYEAINDLSTKYPNKKFATIDDGSDHPLNVKRAFFKEEEGSFLVGVIAGLETQTNKIGFIGGCEFPLIQKYEASFVAGVAAACPSCTVDVKYVTYPPDFSGFNLPDKGKEIALAQYEAGADIIYHAAGGTGIGLFEAAKEVSDNTGTKVWAIGVEKDEAKTVSAELAPYILTSMIKNIDVVIYQIVKEYFDQGYLFPTENKTDYGLSEDAVDFALSGGNLKQSTLDTVEYWKMEIINGDLKVPVSP